VSLTLARLPNIGGPNLRLDGPRTQSLNAPQNNMTNKAIPAIAMQIWAAKSFIGLLPE
jgi:hypothetical protein